MKPSRTNLFMWEASLRRSMVWWRAYRKYLADENKNQPEYFSASVYGLAFQNKEPSPAFFSEKLQIIL